MKKICGSILVALFMACGLLVGAGSGASQAACPYTGCAETTSVIKRPREINPNTPFKVSCGVYANTGTARPVGTIKLTITGKVRKTGKQIKPIVRTFRVDSDGPSGKRWRFNGLRIGQYRTQCAYKKQPDSAFRNSSITKRLLVRDR